MTSRSTPLVALVACVALVFAAFGATAQAVPLPDNDPFYAVPASAATAPSGAVLSSRSINPTALGVPMPAKGWQVLYKTIDNTGQPTATVATVMVPYVPWLGKGPRPVVSYQTAEDGVGTKCAPSYAIHGGLAASASNSAPETLLMLVALLKGWTVVAPDYEGPKSMFLGADGEARGVLDGLRAARAFAPAGISAAAPLGMWGYSGGAFATTVAAQMQTTYAPELKLTGVALGGVVADVRATVRAFSGSAFGGAIPMGLVGVDRAYPEYDIKQYLSPAGLAAMAKSQTDCITDAVPKTPFAKIDQLANDPGILESAVLQPMFERMNPITFPGVPAAPVYHYHARADELAPIGPARVLIQRFCAAGVKVKSLEDPIGEHLTEVAIGWIGAVAYLSDRFAGKPAPSTC